MNQKNPRPVDRLNTLMLAAAWSAASEEERVAFIKLFGGNLGADGLYRIDVEEPSYLAFQYEPVLNNGESRKD